MKLKIIAEVANAHQGDIKILKSLVKVAADCQADAVKFQWFKYDYLATPDYLAYQSYIDLFIDAEQWLEVLKLAKSMGLEVWIDVFDNWGLELVHNFQELIDGLKLPPTILQSNKIIKGIANLNKPILIGVGGWYDHEIDDFFSQIKEFIKVTITLIHGFQAFPTKIEDANLKRINYLRNRYNLEVGFADHTDAYTSLAVDFPVYAYLAGATVIEKHITLDRSKKGYDYYSSLEPQEFSKMVSNLRQAEIIMGDIKVNSSERAYLKNALRTVADKNIACGEIITLEKIAYKRCPDETALMPLEAKEILPQIATESIPLNNPITKKLLGKPIVTIIVICRLKSTRLPKKALLPINGLPSIERCLLNCLAVPNVDSVVLATSDLLEDDPLERFTMDGRVKVVRGDPDNVAKRMVQAANAAKANIALRVTGDNPAVSPEILSFLITSHLKSGKDFTTPANNYAVGTGADVYTVESLNRLLKQPKSLTHTEYLSFYYLNNSKLFSANIVELPDNFRHPEWRLTLDEPKDLEMFEELYKGLNINREPLIFSQLSDYLIKNPKISKINADVSIKYLENQSVIKEIKEATVLE